MSNAAEVMFIWREASREGYGQAVGPMPPQADLWQGQVNLPSTIPDGPVAGTYRRLEPSQEVVVTAQGGHGLPVLLHEDWTAYTESWVRRPGGAITNLDAVVLDVRTHLEKAADSAIARGHMSISPILTTSDGGAGEATQVDGRVILVRPTSV